MDGVSIKEEIRQNETNETLDKGNFLCLILQVFQTQAVQIRLAQSLMVNLF